MQLEDIVPEPYWPYLDVFSKESFDELLERRQWDHAIELLPDAQAFSTKVYPLSPVEQKELDNFLEENLWSYGPVGSAPPSPLWHPQSFLLIKRMENSGSFRTTRSSMPDSKEHLSTSPHPRYYK